MLGLLVVFNTVWGSYYWFFESKLMILVAYDNVELICDIYQWDSNVLLKFFVFLADKTTQ